MQGEKLQICISFASNIFEKASWLFWSDILFYIYLYFYLLFHISSHNKSIARYQFHLPGNFHIRVSVSNHLQQQEPLVAIYPQPIIVQAPVIPGTLEIHVNGWPKTGAPLQTLPGGMATSPVGFVASCQGSHVVFEFDYGDGYRDVIQSYSESITSTGFGSHVYTQGEVDYVLLLLLLLFLFFSLSLLNCSLGWCNKTIFWIQCSETFCMHLYDLKVIICLCVYIYRGSIFHISQGL